MQTKYLIHCLIASAGLTLGASTVVLASGSHEGGDDEFAVGKPASQAQADRTIKITATDKMDFTPAEVEVEPGTVVRFVVENTGSLQHSFTLGSGKWHQQHEDEMQGMAVDDIESHMKDKPNGIVVAPGETGELTWRFEEGGTVPFGCHIPGHFPAGMKGEVDLG